MITQKFNYKSLITKVKYIIVVCFFITINSCKKSESVIVTKIINKEKIKDSLILLKETVFFTESSEGQEIKLFLDSNKKDSIIISENYGETGKESTKFLFNKNLISAENIVTEYKEPISLNTNPIIKREITRTLKSSNAKKKELTETFIKYKDLFISKSTNNKVSLNSKRIDNYSF